MEALDAKWISSVSQPCAMDVHKSPARLGLWNMKVSREDRDIQRFRMCSFL